MSTTNLLLPSASPDLAPLLDRVRTLMMHSKERLTRSGYRQDFEAYQRFCWSHGLVAVPASESTICLYLAFCSKHLRVATISRRLAAIADGLRSMGEDATPLRGFLVQQTWKGIKRTLGVAPRGRAPLLASAIREIAMACPDTILGRRDRSLILTGFWGVFRRSELAALQLATRKSRCSRRQRPEPSSSREERPRRSRTLGRSRSQREKGDLSRPRSRGLDRLGGSQQRRTLPRSGPARRISDSLNPDWIPRILKRAARSAGLPASDIARIAAHSLRPGLVTQCSLNGISPLTVAEITGHRTLSVVKQYCRTAGAIGAASTVASSL